MSLSTEQVLLLENLTYMQPGNGRPFQMPSDYEGQTISDWLNAIDLNQIRDNPGTDTKMSAEEWKSIINAVKNDSTLMDMKITATHVDNSESGGGGRSIVFLDEKGGEAVVAFKGTESSSEWMDNFKGGNVVETEQQKNALNWYREAYDKYHLDQYDITLTGHSKGGNKAKYITILDPTVDRCLSFDGQGFPDKFMEAYPDQIASRQNVIENHNVDYDYVNILLNDVGDTKYYKGYNIGDGGFLENHCPNAFLHFKEDGSFTMDINPNGQAKEMQALDQFFNGLLRSMGEEHRTEALEMVNQFLNAAFSINSEMKTSDIVSMFLSVAADPKYSDELAYILAYFIKYEQENPEMAQYIKDVLAEFGMGDFSKYVDIVDAVLNFKIDTWFGTIDFNKLMEMLGGLSGDISNLPDWLMDKIREYIKNKTGVDLTNEQIRNLLQAITMTSGYLNTINVNYNDKDIRIPGKRVESGGGSLSTTFWINIDELASTTESIKTVAQTLNRIANDTTSESNNNGNGINGTNAVIIKKALSKTAEKIHTLENTARGLEGTLVRIVSLYRKAENSILNS